MMASAQGTLDRGAGGLPVPIPVLVVVIALVVLAAFPLWPSAGPEPVTIVGPSEEIEAVAPADRPVLRPGSQGPAVASLQERLAELGQDPGPADGAFGEQTRRAVSAFQEASGLAADGVVGPETWDRLDRGS